jgi:tetratricopeptide (TPR) repeat protein
MKLVALVAVVSVSVPLSAAAQNPSRASRPAQPTQATSDKVAEAYAQFLLGHRFEDDENFDSAIAAYKRAAALDPTAADITAQLAGLYLRQNKVQEAMSTAEQALKIAPANSEANRVLGVIYAALSEAARENAPRGRASDSPDENVTKAIRYLEAAIAHPEGQADPNVRATLSRLYVKSGAYAKAIPLLTDLVYAPLETALELERKAYAWLRSTHDYAEGVTSFLEKRPAQFSDRVSDGLPEIFPGQEEPAFS